MYIEVESLGSEQDIEPLIERYMVLLLRISSKSEDGNCTSEPYYCSYGDLFYGLS